ncbi:MAG TPA: STAS domain-containing protein [Methylococcaceae bacterium]|nr:STAS domain-containing protein [Methylococcaceae bacterium]
MNIAAEKRNGKTLLSLKEERLDAHNSGELKDYLQRLLESGSNAVVIDLSDVRFIDSSGLGALLSGYKNATLRQGSLVLAGLQSRVQSMFELTRLHRVFDIYPNLQEALDHTEGEDSHVPNRH